MKLIEFIDGHDNKVFINPERVSHVLHYRPKFTLVFFDATENDKQSRIVLQGDVEEIAEKLQK